MMLEAGICMGYMFEAVKRASNSNGTIHGLPFGLRSLAIHGSQIAAVTCIDLFDNWIDRYMLCGTMFGFAKLMRPKGKLWIVPLLVVILNAYEGAVKYMPAGKI